MHKIQDSRSIGRLVRYSKAENYGNRIVAGMTEGNGLFQTDHGKSGFQMTILRSCVSQRNSLGNDDIGAVLVNQVQHTVQIVDRDTALPEKKLSGGNDGLLPGSGVAVEENGILIQQIR